MRNASCLNVNDSIITYLQHLVKLLVLIKIFLLKSLELVDQAEDIPLSEINEGC